MNKKNSENKMPYMPVCMCLGMSIGTAIGAASDNMGMWMCLGVGIGMCIGSAIDASNRAKNTENTESESGTQAEE